MADKEKKTTVVTKPAEVKKSPSKEGVKANLDKKKTPEKPSKPGALIRTFLPFLNTVLDTGYCFKIPKLSINFTGKRFTVSLA